MSSSANKNDHVSEVVDISRSGDINSHTPSDLSNESKKVPERAGIDKIYSAIRGFVRALRDLNPGKKDGIALWATLLDKPTEDTRIKAVTVFQTWFYQNVDAIKDRDMSKFTMNAIKYPKTKKVKFSMFTVLKNSDDPESVWAHLTYILSLINPDEDVLKMVDELKNSSNDAESNFFQEIVGGLVTNMEASQEQDPNKLLANLTSGGAMVDVISKIQHGVESGSMNPSKLFQQLSKVFGQVAESADK